jgi:hypothetical protein
MCSGACTEVDSVPIISALLPRMALMTPCTSQLRESIHSVRGKTAEMMVLPVPRGLGAEGFSA